MPRATIHKNLRGFPPAVALDTSLLVAAIDHTDPKHSPAWSVYRRMVREGTVVAICPQLLRLEFWAGIRNIQRRLRRPAIEMFIDEAEARISGQARLGLRFGVPRGEVELREFMIDAAEGLLDTWLSRLQIVQLRLTKRLLDRARQEVIDWGLRSNDAAMVAVARDLGDRLDQDAHLAAVDQDFERVGALHIWGRQ